jgi:tungstate transport system ATP-binding protein
MNLVWHLDQAQVRFGRRVALAPLTLQIHAGESVALVGANGSGKSTLLRLLHGVFPPSEGAITTGAGIAQAMVFQRPFMLRTSALNNVALALWLRGHRWGQSKKLAAQALARVGLQSQAAQSARTLSGGQQQKLALARGWALGPQVLLLDEPTASLDPHAKREVEQLMAEFMADTQSPPLTMVFASHNLGQVKRLATRVIYLEQGRVLADLPVAEFFDVQRLREASPAAHLFVKGERI